MWIIALLVVIGIGALLLLNHFVPSPLARVVIDYKSGQATLRRGEIPHQRLIFVRDLFRGARISRASVAINATGRLWFSPSVPESIHQQLRNVLRD